MINAEEMKVVFGHGDIAVEGRQDLTLCAFTLGGNYAVGEQIKPGEKDYKFVGAIQSTAQGWFDTIQYLETIDKPDVESKIKYNGRDLTVIFTGDDWSKSIKIVQRAILHTLKIEAERIAAQESKISSSLVYENKNGEVTWMSRSKNVLGITESDIEVISKSLKDDADNTKLSLKESRENIDKVPQDKMKTYEAAMDEMDRDIKYTEDLLSKISNPKNIDEDGWRHIFITLVKDDDEQAASFLRMEKKSDEYYNSLRDTTYRVELISGIGVLKNG